MSIPVNIHHYEKQIKTIHEPIKQILIDVEIGRPASECRNFGICRIKVTNHMSTTPKRSRGTCKQVKAFLNKYEQGVIKFKIPKYSVCQKIKKRFLGGSHFLVEEAYSFPKDICALLGIEAFRVEKGKYPIINEIGHYTICFNKIQR